MRMTKAFGFIGLMAIGLFGFYSASLRLDGPSPALTPTQEAATFRLEPGLDIQLVASEPMVEDPVTVQFDGNGRLWVVEMRGFMTDIDGTEEPKRIGRISVLTDTNADGRMDVRTIYLDSLVMPRAMAFAPGGVLVAENGALWFTTDRNGDLKADSKTLIDAAYAATGLPEHAPNGLLRGVDNWYYNAKSPIRYRLANGKWQRDSTEFRGQWGISRDDQGRLYYNYNWSQLHADLVPPNALSRNKNHKPTTGIDHGLTIDRRVYPIRPNPAVNRGYVPGTLDSAGRLLEFTAACSPLVYRGNALPKEFYGNVFVCEPSGNLIKRNVVESSGILLNAHDPHPGTEFLASTDERFRPVSLSSGPDGALYVVDMYRGLVQHKAYVTPYLREQTLARALVLPVHRGRIWRIVPKGWKPQQAQKLLDAPSADLVGQLSNPNGWNRDMAQALLIDRNDKSTRIALTQLATNPNAASVSRFQALWTLDGLKMSSPDVLLELLADTNALVMTTALRLLEPFAKTDAAVRTRLGKQLLAGVGTVSIEKALQMALSANVLEPSVSQPLLARIATRYGDSALLRDAIMSSLSNQEFGFLQQLLSSADWQTQQPMKEIFLEMLATAIIHNRNPNELAVLLARLNPDKTPLSWQQKAILTGLTIGGNTKKPIKLSAAPKLLITPNPNLDPTRLAALNAMFEWPGHRAIAAATTQKTLLNDEQQKLFALGRQHYLSTCSGCHGTDGAGMARFAPPLIGSEWVLGDEKRLALILLHGIEGPIEVNKKLYDAPDILPVMPSHSTMDDRVLTAILTYIRNEWGNQAGPVAARTVGMTRVLSQGRVMPWTANELNRYMLEPKTPKP